MDQHFNNSNSFLWALLANQAIDAHLYADNLQQLVNNFPQSGILHALLACASHGGNLTQASAYFNAELLYRLINTPSALARVPDESIIIQGSNFSANGYHQYSAYDDVNNHAENYFNSHIITENIAGGQLNTETDEPGLTATVQANENNQPAENDNEYTGDETYDEITGIENIAIGLVANTAPMADVVHTDGTKPTDVSKYHDEKMPYTFMWWLDKTRKEHYGVYQPYVKAQTGIGSTADALQQQYYENIFHITSVEALDKSTAAKTPPANVKRKEDIIIERFIHEEPQIKPQSSDKLDNENKAKKSSEDADELVTETLAAIYADQMLYHKAIAAYKKLVLKFPEKSRYFALKIEQLEKKTN